MTPKTVTLVLFASAILVRNQADAQSPGTGQVLLSPTSASGPVNKPAANRDSSKFYQQKAVVEHDKGSRLRSLSYLERAQSFDSTDRDILRELATSYTDLRKYHQSRDTWKKLLAAGDDSPEVYQQLVNLSFNLKQPDDVILYAQQLKKKDPAAKVNFYLGKVYYEQENYGEAIKALQAAAKEDPKNGEAPYMIARSYADMLNYKQSVPYFQQAVELDTTKNNWMYELGLIYYAMHEDKQSLKYILLAGEHGYRKDNEYLENLGIAYLNAGELEKGVGILEELLKRRPSDLNILNMVAEAYYGKARFQQAMDYWDKVLEYDKENASALYMIGMCYQKKGEKEKGQHLCDKAIEMDPSLGNLKQKKQITGL